MPHTRRDDQAVEAFSASKDLIARAKARAAELGMNKSGYFRYCLALELGYTEGQARSMAQHSSVTQLQAQVRQTAKYPPHRSSTSILNETSNSKVRGAGTKLLKQGAAAVQKGGPK